MQRNSGLAQWGHSTGSGAGEAASMSDKEKNPERET
jgi:hypothetical protein